MPLPDGRDIAHVLDEMECLEARGGTAGTLGPHASLVPCTTLADEAYPHEGQGPTPTGHGHERGEHPMTEEVGLPGQEGNGPFENERDEPNMEQHDTGQISPVPALTELQSNSHIGQEDSLGRGQRKKEPSIRLRDYVTHTTRKLSPSARSTATQCLPGMPYPITHYVSCD